MERLIWEYKVFYPHGKSDWFKFIENEKDYDFQITIEDYENEGWELVSVDNYVMYFKRIK